MAIASAPAGIGAHLGIKSAAATLGLAAVWFVLAWRTPTSTHHFAPLVVAAAWGFMTDRSDRRSVVLAAALGTMVALATVLALGAGDRLLGPTLWHSRPSWPELAGFALLGGVVTLLRGRLLLPASLSGRGRQAQS